MEVMGGYFRPEFLARLSEIIPFAPIGESILLQILEIQLRGLYRLLNAQDMELELTDEAKHMLAFKGFTPRYGARQVSGVIRNYLRRPISRMILTGEMKQGYTLHGSLSETEELVWDILPSTTK